MEAVKLTEDNRYWSAPYWLPDAIGEWLDQRRLSLEGTELKAFDTFAEYIAMKYHNGRCHHTKLKAFDDKVMRYILPGRSKASLAMRKALLEFDGRYNLVTEWNAFIDRLREEDEETWGAWE